MFTFYSINHYYWNMLNDIDYVVNNIVIDSLK